MRLPSLSIRRFLVHLPLKWKRAFMRDQYTSDPAPEAMSTIIQTSDSWPGFANLRRLIIFGDSYSAVGYSPAMHPPPTEDNPLGVQFPGMTWAEDGEPNWVGHLVTNYPPAPLLAYNFARGGDTVIGVRGQMERGFMLHLAGKPDWCAWNASDTLFVTWVGINDCAYATEDTVPRYLETLFELQEDLIEDGARNFLFIDVPPVHRSPSGQRVPVQIAGERRGARQELWNKLLREKAAEFASKHEDATVLLFSSWETFSRVMDNPNAYGFTKHDAVSSASRMWVDFLHPTSKMHDIVARDVAEFLTNVPAYQAPRTPP